MWQLFLDYATIIAGLAAAASVFYLAKQVKVTIEQEKVNRSCDFIKRFNDPIFGKILADTMLFLKSLQEEAEVKEFLEKRHKNPIWIKMHQIIGICLNFFEEIGELYNRGLLYEELIDDFFSGGSIFYYEKAEPYIKLRIEQTERTHLFKEWQIMNETFRKKGLVF